MSQTTTATARHVFEHLSAERRYSCHRTVRKFTSAPQPRNTGDLRAGGTGIAPVRAILESTASRLPRKSATSTGAAVSPQELYLDRELREFSFADIASATSPSFPMATKHGQTAHRPGP